MNQPDAILTADWHIRSSSPICRTDDFERAQFRKIRFIKKLQKKHNCPVLCAGDLFDHWKPSPELLSKTMRYLPDNMICIAGNHDLPGHSLERITESGFNVLDESDYINKDNYVPDYNFHLALHHFGVDDIQYTPNSDNFKSVAMVHEFCYKGRKPFPGALAGVTQLMQRLKGYDLILVGDNHTPFVHKIGRQLLVNPGSLTRQSTDQIKHKPRVYLWYSKLSRVTPVYLPVKQNVITRQHIKRDKERDKRIDAFLVSLDGNFDVHLSFENNMKNVLRTIKNKSVQQKIKDAMDGA